MIAIEKVFGRGPWCGVWVGGGGWVARVGKPPGEETAGHGPGVFLWGKLFAVLCWQGARHSGFVARLAS